MGPVVLKGSQATKEGLGASISSPLLVSPFTPLSSLNLTTKLIQSHLGLIISTLMLKYMKKMFYLLGLKTVVD